MKGFVATVIAAGLGAPFVAIDDAQASPIHLNVPDPDRAEVLGALFDVPFRLSRQTGQLTQAPAFSHWSEAWMAQSAGIPGGLASTLSVSYDRTRALANGLADSGLATLSWRLSKRLWRRAGYQGSLKLGGDFGGSCMRGLSGVGLTHTQSIDLSPRCTASASLGLYKTMAIQQGPVLLQPGTTVQLDTALAYALSEALSVELDGIGSFQRCGRVNGQADPDGGSVLIQLAPTATWSITPAIALQASVAVPVVATGFGGSYPTMTTVGTVIDF